MHYLVHKLIANVHCESVMHWDLWFISYIKAQKWYITLKNDCWNLKPSISVPKPSFQIGFCKYHSCFSNLGKGLKHSYEWVFSCFFFFLANQNESLYKKSYYLSFNYISFVLPLNDLHLSPWARNCIKLDLVKPNLF